LAALGKRVGEGKACDVVCATVDGGASLVAAPHGPDWLGCLEAISDSLSTTGLSDTDTSQVLSIIDPYTPSASDTAVSLARARARSASEAESFDFASARVLDGTALYVDAERARPESSGDTKANE
jgi:hypothetical protein